MSALSATAQFARFCVVGGSSALASLVGVWALVSLADWSYLSATAVVAVIGNLYGFAVNRVWTFKANGSQFYRQLARYLVVVIAASAASLMLVASLVELAQINYLLANALTAAFFAITNFVVHKGWTFAR